MNEIHPQYLLDSEGKRRSVLLAVEEFEELLEAARDVIDTAEIED